MSKYPMKRENLLFIFILWKINASHSNLKCNEEYIPPPPPVPLSSSPLLSALPLSSPQQEEQAVKGRGRGGRVVQNGRPLLIMGINLSQEPGLCIYFLVIYKSILLQQCCLLYCFFVFWTEFNRYSVENQQNFHYCKDYYCLLDRIYFQWRTYFYKHPLTTPLYYTQT